MKNRIRFTRKTGYLGAVLITAISISGCAGSGGGSSTGTYISAGNTILTINGKVVDQNSAPLTGYGVTIDGCPIAITDQQGQYSANIPVINISQVNTIQVYDSKNQLAYSDRRTIDKSICIQSAPDIVIGPPPRPFP